MASGGAPSLNALRAGRGLFNRATGRSILSAIDSKALSDVGTEAMTEGGLSTLARNTGDSEALKHTLLGAVVNPAINSGIDLAMGHGLPSVSDLAQQVVGGAVFSGQNPLGKYVSGLHTEPSPEPNAKGEWSTEEKKPDVTTPYNEKGEDGKYTIDDEGIKDVFKNTINIKPDTKDMSYADRAKANTMYREGNKLSVEDMREALSKKQVDEEAQKADAQAKLDAIKIPKKVTWADWGG